MTTAFGSALGGGTTDNIITTFKGNSTLRSYYIRHNRNGAGGGGFGILWRKNTIAISTSSVSLQYNGTLLVFNQAFSGASGANWTIAGGITIGSNFDSLVTYDAGNSANLPTWYLNGVSQAVSIGTAASGSVSTNAATFCIGNRGSDLIRNWDGVLSHFAVWDRILSAEEASALSSGVSPLFFPQDLKLYWPGYNSAQELINGIDCAVTGTKPINKDLYTTFPGMF